MRITSQLSSCHLWLWQHFKMTENRGYIKQTMQQLEVQTFLYKHVFSQEPERWQLFDGCFNFWFDVWLRSEKIIASKNYITTYRGVGDIKKRKHSWMRLRVWFSFSTFMWNSAGGCSFYLRPQWQIRLIVMKAILLRNDAATSLSRND